ncbi:MAG: sulfite exporter TauE/SafE family protein [Caldanaerobacter sp.]|uniref:sulfite exporter TauE/SafE family protein n=1 Tax=Caldanaerobacter sp. TaxID=2930036 RepID=UPI003C7214DE
MVTTSLEILIFSVIAGIFGALLGLGGGIIVIPALTLLLGVDIRYAIGASIVSVIATSSGAAIAYVRDNITNLRIGMFLEIATTLGAITGAYIAGLISSKYLYIIFGLVLLYSALAMLKKRKEEIPQNVTSHPLAKKLNLEGSYFDKVLNKEIKYKVAGVYEAFSTMYLAGILSGLLGIGSGAFKVLAMDLFMKLPMKVSTATSNFMIGVTAAASAGVYLMRGTINPEIAGPVAIGVLIGATLGTKIMERLKNTTIRKIFIPVLIYISLQMLIKGLGV